MSHTRSHPALSFESATVSASESAELSQTFASSPYSVLTFFLGWAGLGAIAAWILVRRGHDRRTMFGMGLGLGPLMTIVTADRVRFRDAIVKPRVLDQGVARSGTLDVMVLVGERPEAVRSVNAMLDAIRQDLRTFTLVRAVPYEWIDDDDPWPEALDADTALAEAERHLVVTGAARALWPGTAQAVVERFRTQHQRPLVLISPDEPEGEPVSV